MIGIRGVNLTYMSRCKKGSKVVAYTLKGKLYKIFDSAKEASISFGHQRTVDKCLRGETLSAFNLQWRRYDIGEIPDRISPLKKEKRTTISSPIALIDDEGNVIKTYPSIKKASIDNNVDPHSIRDVLNGKCVFAKGKRYKRL